MPTIQIKPAFGKFKFSVAGVEHTYTYSTPHDVAIVTFGRKKTYIVPKHLGYEGEDGTSLTPLTEKEFLKDWSFEVIE